MIAAFAPGSVSNVACGFDVLGFALDEPGDIVIAAPQDEPGVVDRRDSRRRRPAAAAIRGSNTASAAVLALLQRLETTRGVALTIHKGLPLASGIGSSGASAVAAVVAANELLGRPAPMDDAARVRDGGRAGRLRRDSSRQRHTVVLWRLHPRAQRQPPDIVRLPVPDGLACAVLHPHIEVETGAARELLGDQVPLRTRRGSGRNVGGLVAALYTNDLALLSRSLVDHHRRAEARVAGARVLRRSRPPRSPPARSGAACRAPARRSLRSPRRSRSRRAAGDAMQRAFDAASDVGADLWVCPVGRQGAPRRRPSSDDLRQHAREGAGGFASRRRVSPGIAPDGGLYVPAHDSTALPDAWWDALRGRVVPGRRGRDRGASSSATSSIAATLTALVRDALEFSGPDRRARRPASASSSCFTGRRSPSRTSARARWRG